ncbi:MAG TPA: PAS domain-containing protein [Allocoleopsis sp.]
MNSVSQQVSCSAINTHPKNSLEADSLWLYEHALAATNCGIFISDARQPNTPIIYCNSAFLALTGESCEDAIGRNFLLLAGADTDPKAAEKISRAIQTEQACQVEIKHYRKDGTCFWNELTISPIRNHEGEVTHLIGVYSDITSRKLTQEWQQFMQLAIDRVADAILYIDSDGQLLYVNEAACQLLGYTREQLLAKSIHDIDPQLSPTLWARHWRHLRDWGSLRMETQYCTQSDRVVAVEVAFNYLQGNDRDCSCAFVRKVRECQHREAVGGDADYCAGLAIAQSMSQCKQIERERQRTNALFQAQQAAIPDGVLVTDETGAIASYNQRFCQMWQIPERVAQSGDPKKLINCLLPLIAEPQRVFGQVEYIENNPTVFCQGEIKLNNGCVFDCYCAPAISPSGEFYGRIWSFRDISERHQTEAQLRQQATREQLLAGMNQRIRQSLDLNEVLQTAVEEVRQFLKCDRVVIYRFHPDWSGTIAVESVGKEWTPSLGANIEDTCFKENKAFLYQQGHIKAINDIYNAGLSQCHIELLERFQVRANLVVPILQGENLWGLLIAYQCSGTRQWKQSSIELLRQLSVQLGIAIQQATLFQQLADELTERKAAEAALRESQTTLKQQTAELKKTVRELKQTQLQLIQTEKMSSLGQLVAGVAHEINNPVTFIYGNIAHAERYANELLELVRCYTKHYPQPKQEIADFIKFIDFDFVVEDFPKLLKSMNIGVSRIRQIVQSLKNFSRLDEAERKLVDIHEGIENTLLILQHRLKPEAANIQLIKEYGNLPLIECYAGQLNQVFMNLLNNAVDALEKFKQRQMLNQEKTLTAGNSFHQGKIEISTSVVERPSEESCNPFAPASKHAVIRIADNGPGITKDVKERIFDPFFTTKPVGKGTGLGLSISYQIVVEKHGGQLHCWSEPGKGTEFIVEIPIVSGILDDCQTIDYNGAKIALKNIG